MLLPDGYADHPNQRYPVLWLLHGASGGSDTWLPGITQLLPHFPGIVVMPDGGLFGMYTDWWNGGQRGGPAWATYHLSLLRQTIEQRYRIRPERRWHAVAGISMGGQGALRYAAMLPGYFGSVAGFSAALPDMQSPEAQVGLGLLAAANQVGGATYDGIFGPASGAYAEGNSPMALVSNLAHTRIYLTSGWGIPCVQDPVRPNGVAIDLVTETFVHEGQLPFAMAARTAGADVTTVTQCGVHTFEVWNRAIPAANDWGFFQDVPDRPQSLALPHGCHRGRDVGPALPLLGTPVPGRRVRPGRDAPHRDRQRHGVDQRPTRLCLASNASVPPNPADGLLRRPLTRSPKRSRGLSGRRTTRGW